MGSTHVSKQVDQFWQGQLRQRVKDSGLSVEEFCRQEQKKCKADVFYFIDNYVYVKNKYNEENDSMPKHLKLLVHGDKIKFVLYPPQRELVQSYLDNQYTISNKTRQSGISTTAQTVALWILTFQNNKEVLIISKNLEAAKKFLAEMKFMHQNLPWFLRRRILDDNKTTFSLGSTNNASIMFSLTSGKSSGRSASATFLVIDEAEFIQSIHEIWSSAAPTLSATGGKVIVISTPWMTGSWFNKTYEQAKQGQNEFVPVEVPWTSIPGRDKAWYDQQCRLLNNDRKKIKTELDMKWIIPGDQFYDEELLEEKKILPKLRKEGDVIIYKEPEPDHLYIMGVDVYEGGEDSNAFYIIDLMAKLDDTDSGIVAECVTKRLDWYDLTKEWANYYNNAMLAIERNKGMGLIQEYINANLEDRLVNRFDFKKKDFRDDEYGVFIDTAMRVNLLSMSVRWLNIKENIPETLKQEMLEFVRKGQKYQGLKHDDLLFAFMFTLYYINIIENYPQVVKKNANLKRFLESLTKIDKVKQGPSSSKIYNSLKGLMQQPISNDDIIFKSMGIKTTDDKDKYRRVASKCPC